MAMWDRNRKTDLDFRDEDNLENLMPYDSLTKRDPLQDLSVQGQIDRFQSKGDGDDYSDFADGTYDTGGSRAPASIRQSVMQKISSKMPSRNSADYANDPLMKQYDEKEADLQGVRDDQREANRFSNFAQAASIAAQGSNKPVSPDSLYKNIGDQNKDLLSSSEGDLDRRQRVLNAIEARKSRESVATDNREMRQAVLQQGMQNRERGQDLRGRTILGRVVHEINNDPIIKPSEMNMASLVKSKGILDNPDVPLTSQVLSDAEQDIASALTLRGMGATEGKIQRTELVDLNRKIGEIKQKFGNTITDLRLQAPEIVEQVKRLNNALLADYQTTISQRRNNKVDDYSDVMGDDPFFSPKLEKLRGGMNTRAGLSSEGSALAQSPKSSGGIINEANAGESEGPHGKSIRQKGVTFTWNGQKYVAGGQ